MCNIIPCAAFRFWVAVSAACQRSTMWQLDRDKATDSIGTFGCQCGWFDFNLPLITTILLMTLSHTHSNMLSLSLSLSYRGIHAFHMSYPRITLRYEGQNPLRMAYTTNTCMYCLAVCLSLPLSFSLSAMLQPCMWWSN